MAHHYSVDPVDYLLEVAEKIDDDIENILSSTECSLTTDGVIEILDTEKECIEKHGQEAYKILQSFHEYEETPEELARDLDMTRTEFFQYGTILDQKGLIDLDNGTADITAKGGHVLEGIEYLTHSDKN